MGVETRDEESTTKDRPEGRTLAVVNQKGGVGKTTTAINLAASLAACQQTVLLVDCDPQANATRGVGLQGAEPTLLDVLSDDTDEADTTVDPGEAVHATEVPGLFLLPSERQLVGVEVEFVGEQGWQWRLRDRLSRLGRFYDWILLDCPPSLGHLTVSALSASDGVLIPIQCEYFALEGVSDLARTLDQVRQGLHPDLEIEGVLLTMYDDRTNLARDVVEEIRRHFGDRVFRTIVPRNIRLAEAPSHGQPVLQYDARSRGAQAYLALAKELLVRRSS